MSAIKVGDMAVVIHACCDGAARQALGKIGEVVAIFPLTGGTCIYCGTQTLDLPTAMLPEIGSVYVSWLRKIDPDQGSDREREFDQLSRRDKVPA